MIKWRVYYGDGSTFSDHNGSAWSAPGRDVQVIVLADSNHGWRTQAGDNYYVWDNRGDDHRWWGVDDFGLFDYLIDPGYKRVLFGRRISNQEFSEIFKRASVDDDIPHKTSFAHQERKPL